MSTRQTKDYPHITGVYGDNGESPGALAVHAVLDPSPNYPDAGRIIVGSPRKTPTIEGYIPDLGGFNCGPDAAVKLAHTLLDAAAVAMAGRDVPPPSLWNRISCAPHNGRILAWESGPVVAEWSAAKEAWVTCEESVVIDPTHWRPIPPGPDVTPETDVSVKPAGAYIASRASVPGRSAAWRRLRDIDGWLITSSWIDEAGPGQTDDLGKLWTKIESEVCRSSRFILYVEPDDFPLKGALIEAGIALACFIPIRVVAPGVTLDPVSFRPLGSWVRHPLVSFCATMEEALDGAARRF